MILFITLAIAVSVITVSKAQFEGGLPYPTYSYIPDTDFDCSKKWGFYADPSTGCQVFHLCKYGQKISASFLCNNATLFHQEHPQRCDFWYKVNCR